MDVMTKWILGIVGTILSAGIIRIIYGQEKIREEARKGRKELHERIDPLSNSLIELATFHKTNHPGQL